MSMSMDPLKLTTQELHRFWFKIHTQDQWYAVINECRLLYGTNWRTQRNVLKRFKKAQTYNQAIQRWLARHWPHAIWFEVPDPAFATWVTVKHAIEVSDNRRQSW